tara:strand:+ start:5990 stop:6856 length:867 start_codon:yes stop_codon:yes gene_type:complete
MAFRVYFYFMVVMTLALLAICLYLSIREPYSAGQLISYTPARILMKRPIYIYFHVCGILKWKNIVKKLFDYLEKLDAFSIISELRVCILGSKKVIDDNIWNYHHKIKIHATDPNPKLYERFTLDRLREDSKKESFDVFYMHSKGITRATTIAKKTKHLNDWIDQMMKSCWIDYAKVLFNLQNYDAVGVLLTNNTIGAHFSGNFWWSKSDYLKDKGDIGPGYLDAERWILSSDGCRALNLSKETTFVPEYIRKGCPAPGSYTVFDSKCMNCFKHTRGKATGQKYLAKSA